jgi:AraC-like DNA-binding protein
MAFDRRAGSVWVSADALAGCVEVASSVGFDILPYLARHGIDPELIENSRGLLSYVSLSDCLEDVAQSEQCPDFGFRLGQRQKPLQFGMISQVLQFAPTVGEAIRIFLRYRDLYSQSSHWDLGVEEDIAYLNRRHFGPNGRRSPQISILSVTRGFEAIRSMIAPDWAPIAVYLSTDDVAFSAALRSFFGAPVFFNSHYDAIAFEATDLERTVPTGNAEILKALTNHFDRLFPRLNRRGPVSDQVQKQMRLASEGSGYSLIGIARHFGMHPRTLQRALSAEGTSFRQLDQETRMSIATDMLKLPRMQLSEVATSAGYRHQSSLSRAYRRLQGRSPSQSRREAGARRDLPVKGSVRSGDPRERRANLLDDAVDLRLVDDQGGRQGDDVSSHAD